MEFNGALDAHYDELMARHQKAIDKDEAIANWKSEVLDALEEAMQALKKNDVDTAMCCIDYAMKLI
jgi:hypothetical protein